MRGAVASGSCYDLEAFVVRSHSEGLNQAVVPDGLGKFVQLGLIEGAAGVGGGFVNELAELSCWWNFNAQSNQSYDGEQDSLGLPNRSKYDRSTTTPLPPGVSRT